MIQRINLFFALLIILFSNTISANDFVRVELDYAGNIKNIDIELFPDAAPFTVANFLNYVDNGSYSDSFVNRSVSGFILQTGGYTFNPLDPLNTPISPTGDGNGLEIVPEGPLSPVINEFGISNTRGTIAMAKLPDQPDSATSEWFINLSDNQANLDNQNGGFTVFGQVIDNGMSIADDIASYPVHTTLGTILGGSFTSTPVIGTDAATASSIYEMNLIMIRSIQRINRPVINASPSETDFGLDIAGDGVSESITVTITNSGNENMDIAFIDRTLLSAEFGITNDNCSNTSLQPVSITPTANCTIDITFSASSVSSFNNTISIPYTDQASGGTYELIYAIKGTGAPTTPVIKTSTSLLIFPETVINSNSTRRLAITNGGGGTLTITSEYISEDLENSYSVTSSCAGTTLQFEETCILSIQLSPTTSSGTIDNKYGKINIVTSEGTETIQMVGESSKPVVGFQYSLDFIAQVGSEYLSSITPINLGNGHLIFSSISITGPDAQYFDQVNNCPDTINVPNIPLVELTTNMECTVVIRYRPLTNGPHSATITFNSNAPDTPTVDIPLNADTDNALISVSGNTNLGITQINGIAASTEITITNTGAAPLEITNITGLPINNFSETNNCTGTNIQILANNSCTINISFDPLNIGPANTALSIESNDLTNPTITINLEALVDIDTDGIAAAIELAGPNSGDSNLDGITDDVQNNVATYQTPDGKFISLLSDNSTLLGELTSIENLRVAYDYSSEMINDTVNLNYGLQAFTIQTPTGDGVKVGIYLPAGSAANNYYKFGPTPDDSTPHWYDFNYDPNTLTGAQFIGNSIIETPYGTIQRSVVILHFVDGDRGDDDLTFDGKISQAKGVITTNNSQVNSSSAGSISLLLFISIVITLIARTRQHHVKQKFDCKLTINNFNKDNDN